MTTIDPEFGERFRARWLRDVHNAHQRGFAEGRATGKVGAILEVLQARGLELSEEQRQRIASCRDLDRLSAWLERAVGAVSAECLFR
jgi:hypothetical protein